MARPRTARCEPLDRAERSLRWDRTLARDWCESSERRLIAEPIDPRDANEPTLPIDRTEPTLPTDRIEWEDPIDRIDPFDLHDSSDLAMTPSVSGGRVRGPCPARFPARAESRRRV